MYTFPGFYTLGELLCQLDHFPALNNAGFRLRVRLPLMWPPGTFSGSPDVEIWPDGLTFGIPRITLLELTKLVAVFLDKTLPGDVEAFFDEKFPAIWANDLENDADDRPLRVVRQTRDDLDRIKLDKSQMRPHALGAFQLLHPLERKKVVVPLQIDDTDFVATVPQDVIRTIVNKIGDALGG